MARKYLTPIDLTGLELTNFKIQNLSSNPSAYGKGHTYYNTTANELRTYNGTSWETVGGNVLSGVTGDRPSAGHTGRLYFDTTLNVLFFDNGTAWVQDGVSQSDLSSAISGVTITNTDGLSEGSTNLYYTDSRARNAVSVSENQGLSYDSGTGVFSVDYTNLESTLVTDGFAKTSDIPSLSGYIQTGDDASLTSLILTHNGSSGENLKFNDDAWMGDVNLSNTINVKGVEDSTEGYISFGQNGTTRSGGGKKNYIGSDSNDLTLGSANDIVLLPTSGYAYIGTQLMDGSNRIATLSDISAENYISSVSSPLSVTSGNLSIDLGSYLTTSDASSTYLTQTNAGNTYLTQTDASSTYLTQTNAGNTYLTQTDASSTYQTQDGLDSAVSTLGYAKTSDIPSLSGYVTETGTENLSNKTFQGDVYFQSAGGAGSTLNTISVDNATGHMAVASGYELELISTNDINLHSTNGNIVLNADGNSYIGSATSGNEIATQGFVTGQNYITSSGQYIQGVGSEFSVTSATLNLNLDATLHVDGSNNLAVQYGSGLTTDGSGYLAVDTSTIATKTYVDGVAQGLNVKNSVAAATTSGNVSDPTDVKSSDSIDGSLSFSSLSNGARVLVKNATSAAANGIYVWAAGPGTLTRASDEGTPAKGDFVFVEAGTHAAQGWILSDVLAPATYTWTQFSAAGEYTAGNGIDISGNTISAVVNTASGLELQSSGIVINNGTGLEFNGDTGAIQVVDYNSLTKKYSATIGDGSATTYDVTHNFNTRDVEVTVYDAATYDEVVVDVTRTTVNKVTIGFGVAPSSGAYRVVVVG